MFLTTSTFRPGGALPAWNGVRTIVGGLTTFAVLPNVLMLLAAAKFNGARPWIDMDYLAVGALAPLLTPWALVALMTSACCLDVAFTFASAFGFDEADVAPAIAEMVHFSAAGLLTIALVVTVLAVVVWILLRSSRSARSSASAVACAVFGVLTFGVDALNGSNAVVARPELHLSLNPATSRVYAFVRSASRSFAPSDGPALSVSSASDVLRDLIRGVPRDASVVPTKIVLVLVESMGDPQDPARSALLAPLYAPGVAARYAITSGTVPFDGATTGAEFRELCGMAADHRTGRHQNLTTCLPNQLAAMGYETVSIHGYSGALFRRRDWYPSIGFQKIEFLEDLRHSGDEPECGLIFRGICDRAAVLHVRDELTRMPRQRQFVYWLTLGSHFPVDPRLASREACSQYGSAATGRTACALFVALRAVIDSVAALAADTRVPSAWYVIVADHAPPFLSGEHEPFAGNAVRFIELRPKANSR